MYTMAEEYNKIVEPDLLKKTNNDKMYIHMDAIIII